MSKLLHRSRQSAYAAQGGLCFYCVCAMWLRSSDELTKPYGITENQAKMLQCSAEHLIPRSEGGSDKPSNIVAACLRCNGTRHKRKIPPRPDRYRSLVRSRIAKGRWHPRGLAEVLHGALVSQHNRRDNLGSLQRNVTREGDHKSSINKGVIHLLIQEFQAQVQVEGPIYKTQV